MPPVTQYACILWVMSNASFPLPSFLFKISLDLIWRHIVVRFSFKVLMSDNGLHASPAILFFHIILPRVETTTHHKNLHDYSQVQFHSTMMASIELYDLIFNFDKSVYSVHHPNQILMKRHFTNCFSLAGLICSGISCASP